VRSSQHPCEGRAAAAPGLWWTRKQVEQVNSSACVGTTRTDSSSPDRSAPGSSKDAAASASSTSIMDAAASSRCSLSSSKEFSRHRRIRCGGVHRSRLTSCISGRAGRRCAARCTARRGVGTQRTATSSCARPRRTRPVTAQRVVARRVRTDSTGPERNLGEASRMETRPFRTSELCPLSDRYDADSTRAAGLTARQDQLEQGQQRQFRTPARSA